MITSTAGALSQGTDVGMHRGPTFRAARAIVLLTLGVIYAGAIQFFITVSSGLLYGTYVVILGCLAVCLFFDWSPVRNLRTVLPYLVWLCAYFLWGMMVSSDSDVAKEGIKYLIKNVLIISALAMVVERFTLRTFVQLVLLAAIGNFGLCIWQTYNPTLVEDIAQTREQGATAYNVMRPAGLWSNPDEAATAFIFALILSRWAPGLLAGIARICAVAGIFLTASRTGVYVLAICLAVFALIWVRTHGFSLKLAAGLCLAALAAMALVVAVSDQPWFRVSESAQINRIFDLSESTRGAHEASRTEIAVTALHTATEGPWYGSGLFTFQKEEGLPTVIRLPAHNVFLTVLGEGGPLVALSYGIVLCIGIARTVRLPLEAGDQITLLLMWFCYLLIGLTWHNQFTAFSGMLYIALLWHLPAVLRTGREHDEVEHEI